MIEIVSEGMKLLEKIAREIPGDDCKDVVVLHINHCMSNSFFF